MFISIIIMFAEKDIRLLKFKLDSFIFNLKWNLYGKILLRMLIFFVEYRLIDLWSNAISLKPSISRIEQNKLINNIFNSLFDQINKTNWKKSEKNEEKKHIRLYSKYLFVYIFLCPILFVFSSSFTLFVLKWTIVFRILLSKGQDL